MKRVCLCLLVLFGLFTLVGCGAPAENAPASLPAAPPSDPTTAEAAPQETVPTETSSTATKATDTPIPNAAAVPVDVDAYSVSSLLVEGNLPEFQYEPCMIGPLALQCPVGWLQMAGGMQGMFASNPALIDGFAPGEIGGQIQISLLNALEAEAGSPESLLQLFVSNIFPELVQENLLNGPVSLVLNGMDLSAVLFRTVQNEAPVVTLLIVGEQYGRVILIVASASESLAEAMLPDIAGGLRSMVLGLAPTHNVLLPPGTTLLVEGELDGTAGAAFELEMAANPADRLFAMVAPMEGDPDVVVDLVHSQSNELITSVERQGTKYLFYKFEKPDQYRIMVRSKNGAAVGRYQIMLVGSAGIAFAAPGNRTVFPSRIAEGQPLSYLFQVDPGAALQIAIQPADGSDQDYRSDIFALDNLDQPLLTIDSGGSGALDEAVFTPQSTGFYRLFVFEKDGKPGEFALVIGTE